jgi:hypothetical protein
MQQLRDVALVTTLGVIVVGDLVASGILSNVF